MLDAGLADHFQIIPGIYNTRSIYKYEDGPHNQFAGTLNTSTCAVELSNFEIDIFLKKQFDINIRYDILILFPKS